VRAVGNAMSDRPVQEKKEYSPILTIVDGNVMLVSPVHELKV
jgi:hypothetical protein